MTAAYTPRQQTEGSAEGQYMTTRTPIVNAPSNRYRVRCSAKHTPMGSIVFRATYGRNSENVSSKIFIRSKLFTPSGNFSSRETTFIRQKFSHLTKICGLLLITAPYQKSVIAVRLFYTLLSPFVFSLNFTSISLIFLASY